MLFKQLLENNERKISMISVDINRPSKVQINPVKTQHIKILIYCCFNILIFIYIFMF